MQRTGKKITKDRWVLETIKVCQIQFTATPQQVRKPHPLHYSAGQIKLVTVEVRDLLIKSAVSQLSEKQSVTSFYLNLFLAPKKDGGQRPVVNMKALNKFVALVHFKMKGIHMMKDLIKPGDWLTKVDLKDT